MSASEEEGNDDMSFEQHSGLDESIPITTTGYPRLDTQLAGLDLVVLEEYDDDLLCLILHANATDFREIYFQQLIDTYPNIKRFMVRDGYLAVAYTHPFANELARLQREQIVMHDVFIEILNDLFEKADLPTLDLLDESVDKHKFYNYYFEQLAAGKPMFYFGYYTYDKFVVYGQRGYVDLLLTNADETIEFPMTKSMNIIKSFQEYRDFLMKFEEATGTSVNHNLEENKFELEGTYVNCAYFCAFVKYFMNSLVYENTFLPTEELEKCVEKRLQVDVALADLEVYFNITDASLWGLDNNTAKFDEAKQIISMITGVEFSNEQVTVTEMFSEGVAKYVQMWEEEIKERFKGLDIQVLGNEVKITGIQPGIDRFISFRDRIIEKKVDFGGREVVKEALKDELNYIKNICFEILDDSVVFTGPDEDVQAACDVLDRYFEDSMMEQSLELDDVIITEEKCKCLFFLFRDPELYEDIKEQFLNDGIIRELVLYRDSNAVCFVLTQPITEHDLIVALDTRVNAVLCKEGVEFFYPTRLGKDKNNNIVNKFVERMERSYGCDVREALIKSFRYPLPVVIDRITCGIDGKVSVSFYGTQNGVDELVKELNVAHRLEVRVEDHQLLKQLATGLVQEWKSFKEMVVRLEVDTTKKCVVITGPKMMVVFLACYLNFICEHLVSL